VLHGQELRFRKTQTVDYQLTVIDTPGEYLENRRYYAALRATAGDCAVIGLVQDATDRQSVFPPQFAGMFYQSVIGIVTKIEASVADSELAEQYLRRAGAEMIIRTSSYQRLGLEQLQQFSGPGSGAAQ
jgi:ethanolamine utilization protein EutP